MVMVSGAGGLHRKGGRAPPPKRGRLGGGRCVTDTLLSPSACSTEGFFRRKNAFRIQRSRAPERGLSRGNLSPLTLFWFLLQEQKKRHGGEPYKLSPCGDLSPPKASRNDDEARFTGAGARDCDWPRKYPADRREETVSCPSAGRQKESRALWAAGSALQGKEKAPVGALGAGGYCCRMYGSGR